MYPVAPVSRIRPPASCGIDPCFRLMARKGSLFEPGNARPAVLSDTERSGTDLARRTTCRSVGLPRRRTSHDLRRACHPRPDGSGVRVSSDDRDPGPGRTGALGAGTAPPLWGCESFGQGIAAHFARLGQTRPGVWGASPARAAGNDLDNAMAERMRHMLRFGMLEVRVCFSGLQPRFRYPRWGRSVVLELQGLSAACPRRLLYRGQK